MRWLEFLLSSAIEIWLLIIGFIWIVVIAVDKIKKIDSVKAGIPLFTMKMRALLKKGNLDGALNYCMEEKSAIANIVKRGLKKSKYGRTRITEEAESAGQIEVMKLEERLATLATISTAAPLVGFLGTILSLGSLFSLLQDPQGIATFGDFSHFISSALVSSGLGLAIGIVAMAVYNYLVNKISKVVMDLERFASVIFDLLDTEEQEIVTEEEIEG